jgi:biopolymer transport protein ExbB
VIDTMLNAGASLLAHTTPTVPPASSAEIESVWDFVLKGGVLMIPIGLCSLIALTVFAERLISLRRKHIIPPGFMPGLEKKLNGGLSDPEGAIDYCTKDGSPAAAVCAAGLKRIDGSIEAVERCIAETGEREALKLRKHLRVLSVIAAISPLMGLLGTIFGMIKAFQTVALSGDALGRTETLAEGIYVAMITTAAGLIVAIPCLIFYHWLSAKVQKLVMEMDQMSVEFVERIFDKRRCAGDAPDVDRLKLDASPADAPADGVLAARS